MMTARRTATLAVAVLIAAAATLPAGAVALPNRRGLASGETTRAVAVAARQGRADLLAARIAKVLQRRKVRFDLAQTRIATRIDRVAQLADKIAAAGKDVTEARSALSRARAHLAQAETLEAQAVAAFQAIPSAQNKREAFKAARAIGRGAVEELKAARKELRASASALRRAVGPLKTSRADGLGAHRA